MKKLLLSILIVAGSTHFATAQSTAKHLKLKPVSEAPVSQPTEAERVKQKKAQTEAERNVNAAALVDPRSFVPAKTAPKN